MIMRFMIDFLVSFDMMFYVFIPVHMFRNRFLNAVQTLVYVISLVGAYISKSSRLNVENSLGQ